MKLTRLGILLLATVATLARADDAAEEDVIRIQSVDGTGEVELDPDTGAASATHGVVIRHRGTTLRAQTVKSSGENEVEAEGDVNIESGQGGRSQAWRGQKARYNFNTQTLTAENFRTGQRPFFVSGKSVTGERTNNVYSATDSFFTTDDLAVPGYRIKAREIEIRPGEYIEARNAVVYVGSVPVFYWPKYHRSFQRHTRFWTVTPGYRSVYGPFSLNRYHWVGNTNVQYTVDADWRLERGFGGGPGMTYDLGKWGTGSASIYLAHDEDPWITRPLFPVREDRRRSRFFHSLTNGEGLTIKARLEEQNDALVVRDFFESEFRRDPQPRTFLEVNQAWRNWTLDVLAQPQVNSFFQTVERLPDIKLTGLRQQVGESPLYYEGDSSFAYLRFRPGMLGGTNYAGIRGDSYHQITVPNTYFGWLNVAPRVGARATYYGEPDNQDQIQHDQTRGVFNTGVEFTTKASRTWAGARSKAWDVEGLRHIVEPGLNYVYVPQPGERPPQLPQYDFEFVTPRLLPIDFPDYNSIDSIDSRNVIRWSLRNRLQTRRAGDTVDILNWNVYTDWRLRPQPDQATFPELYSDMDLAPARWVLLTSQVRYDINQSFWREANHHVTFQPGQTWAWTVGHRYLRSDFDSYGLGNNLIFNSVALRLNENWGVRASQRFEARDGVLEEHSYSVYRDLRSWTAAFGVRFRDNRQGVDDWAIVLTFQLKAFPRFKLGQDTDQVERLFGG
jgi:lipopolysaccharide assembly outer membrane protein LptD (OstA)